MRIAALALGAVCAYAAALPHAADAQSGRTHALIVVGIGGTAEYLSLLTGFRLLLIGVALCYIGAVVARGRQSG